MAAKFKIRAASLHAARTREQKELAPLHLPENLKEPSGGSIVPWIGSTQQKDFSRPLKKKEGGTKEGRDERSWDPRDFLLKNIARNLKVEKLKPSGSPYL